MAVSTLSNKSGKLITCILPKGTSHPVMESLSNMGITRYNMSTSRGFNVHDNVEGQNGLPKSFEKEVLTVVARDDSEAEELFDFLYIEAKVNKLGGGIMYMTSLDSSVPYLLS